MAHWLLKTEPETYSFAQLLKDGKTAWNGVRNYQARNFLQKMAVGDTALIYHSGKEKAVVGIARVTRAAYVEEDCWVQVDIAPVKALKAPFSLTKIKSTPALRNLPLIRQSRLSVMPIEVAEAEMLVK